MELFTFIGGVIFFIGGFACWYLDWIKGIREPVVYYLIGSFSAVFGCFFIF